MDWNGAHSDGIIEVIKQYCEEDGIKFNQLDDRSLHASFQGRHFSYPLLMRERVGQRQALFIATVPVKVPPEQRPVVAELLCRANFGLILGNFELGFETGEVRYKTSVDVEGGTLTPAMVKTLMHVNLSTADRYANALIAVLYRGLRPIEAMAELEAADATKRLAAQAALN